MAELKRRFVGLDAKVKARDDVAEEPLDRQVKLMGLKTLLPSDVKLILEAQTDVADGFASVFMRSRDFAPGTLAILAKTGCIGRAPAWVGPQALGHQCHES